MTLDDLLNGARRFARGAVLAAGLGLAALGAGSAAQPLKAGPFSVDQVEAPAVAAHVPRRHLQRWTLTQPSYVLDTFAEGDGFTSTLTLANTGTTQTHVYVVSGDAAARQSPVIVDLLPGASATMTAQQLGVSQTEALWFQVDGDAANLHLEQRTRNAAGQGYLRRPLDASDVLATGEHAWLHGADNPLTTAQDLAVVNGGSQTATLDIQVLGPTGNIQTDTTGGHAIWHVSVPAFSVARAPMWSAVNLAAFPDAEIEVFPSSNNVAVVVGYQYSGGDRGRVRATSERQAPGTMLLPVVERANGLTTMLDVINPEQTPATRALNVNFQEQNVSGTGQYGNTKLVEALFHYNWSDMVSNVLVSIPQGTTHIGASGAFDPDKLIVHTRVHDANDNGADIPPLDQNTPCGGATQYRCSVLDLEATTALGFYNISGLTTTVNVKGFDASGTQTGTLTEALGQYENTSIANVKAALGGATRLEASVVRSDSIGPGVDEFLTWATTTTGNDTHYAAAKQLPAAPVTGEQYVERWLDPLFSGATPDNHVAYHLEYDLSRCMLRDDCGIPNLTHDFAVILNRGIGETWTVTQFEQWLTDMTDGVVSSTNEELCTQYKPFTQGGNGTGWSLTTSPSTCTGAPGGVQLTTTDNAQAYSLVRGDVVNWVHLHPERYGGNTTTGPNLDFDPQWYTTTPR